MHDQKPLIKNANSDRIIILLHGRGGSAKDLMQFAEQYLPKSKFIALQADNNEWYPYPFLYPKKENEPFLSSALKAIHKTIISTKVPLENIFILGFSQGACLAAEYASQNPAKYGGIFVCSGGLIGDKISPPIKSMQKTPIFFGCSLNDPHIPISRVNESIDAFEKKDALITKHLYPGHSHTITDKEIQLINEIILSSER